MQSILGLNCVHDIDIRSSTIRYNKTATQIDNKTAQETLTAVNLIPERKQ